MPICYHFDLVVIYGSTSEFCFPRNLQAEIVTPGNIFAVLHKMIRYTRTEPLSFFPALPKEV